MRIDIDTEVETVCYDIEKGELAGHKTPLCDNMEYSYNCHNGNSLGSMKVSISLHNILSDDNTYIDYHDTNLKSFCGATADGTYDITYNGFNYFNFMDEIGMNKRGRVLTYMEDNDLDNWDFYTALNDDTLADIGLSDEDYDKLSTALNMVRQCMPA